MLVGMVDVGWLVGCGGMVSDVVGDGCTFRLLMLRDRIADHFEVRPWRDENEVLVVKRHIDIRRLRRFGTVASVDAGIVVVMVVVGHFDNRGSSSTWGRSCCKMQDYERHDCALLGNLCLRLCEVNEGRRRQALLENQDLCLLCPRL